MSDVYVISQYDDKTGVCQPSVTVVTSYDAAVKYISEKSDTLTEGFTWLIQAQPVHKEGDWL